MRRLALVSALVLSSFAFADSDAGTPDAGSIFDLCPDAPGLEAARVDGGVFLPELLARRDACELEACKAYVKDLATAPDAGTWRGSDTFNAITGAVSTILGFYVANRTARHLPLWPP